MFKDSDRNFMEEKMKILVDSIESELNKPYFANFKDIAVCAVSSYIFEIRTHGRNAKTHIREKFSQITNGMCEEDRVYQTLDALRHSFCCYAGGGLYQLYTLQENEEWHPKIKLTEILEPNAIALLPQNLILYRGCCISEFETQNFGQAWSTSRQIAEMFAYSH